MNGMTIMQQLQQVFAAAPPHSGPGRADESPSTIKLYHASIGRNTPCRRVLAHSDAEAALKASEQYPGAYVTRAKTCRCSVLIHAGNESEGTASEEI